MIDFIQTRRGALASLGLGAAGSTFLTVANASAQARPPGDLAPSGAASLRTLTERLARAPRRRDFKTSPMVLTDPSQWDAEALSLLMAYRGEPKQVWDNTDIDSPWLNLMRNSVNAQIWSFKHPDFVAVSATHGTAHLALFDQAMWDKYGFAKMTGGKMASNTLIIDKGEAGSASDYENPDGLYSPGVVATIPELQGVGYLYIK